MSEDVVDHCGDCGAPLAYHGNRLTGGTYCDSCYDSLEAMLP